MNSRHVLAKHGDGTAIAATVAVSILTGAFFIAKTAAAEDASAAFGGTSMDPSAAQVVNNVALAPVSPSAVFHGAQYGTGGVALRNRGGGGIEVSGVVGPVKAAFLYWAVITNGAAPPAVQSIRLERLLPTTAAFVTLTGTQIGTGRTPCWGGGPIRVYRATVPLSLANGNGHYALILNPGASGLTGGQDPWVPPVVFPLFEGASLVIIGTGTSTVALYDNGLAGNTFNANPGINYTLNLPAAVTGGPVLFDDIGADGQRGSSRSDSSGVATEVTTLNGIRIAGPGSPANDSDWNGNSGLPLPQLWDDTGHDVTAAVPRRTTRLNFRVSSFARNIDCLAPVANVVSFK